MNTWQISEYNFEPKNFPVNESIYTIGNGYFATRGSFEEGYPGASVATLLFGVFDDIPIGKEELADAPDWLPIWVKVDGERMRLEKGRVLEFSRVLDMRRGVLTRNMRWESPSGLRLKIECERFASLAEEHVGAIRYQVMVEEAPRETKVVELSISAFFNIAVGDDNVMHWENVDLGSEEDFLWLHSQTRHSHVQLVQVMSFTTQAHGFHSQILETSNAPSICLSGKVAIGEAIAVEKIVAMYTSRDEVDPKSKALAQLKKIEPEAGASKENNIIHNAAKNTAYTRLRARSEECWHDFWQISDILIEGDERIQQAIRYNIYQLRISTSAHDSRYNTAAKGLTGFGYHGHILQDTELFILPFFTYVHPAIARNMLLYRYHLLPAAHEKAKQNGYRGAQYPWESTLDGQEATPIAMVTEGSKQLTPVLTAELEIHITACVAWAVWLYWHVTGDDQFMHDYGAEMLLDTATFWASRIQYNAENHVYEISAVIGPDEWHERVNNNAYTNYMAHWNIETATHVLQWLRAKDAVQAEHLTEKLDITNNLLEHWRDILAHMYIPQQQNGLFEQFDGFLQLKQLDQHHFEHRTSSYQAILTLQVVNQYQVLKQADALLLLTLLREKFDQKTKQVNWDYYFPITDDIYGSSLSPALHVILACELGLADTAYDLLMKGALIDLENQRGNTKEGIHLACCGGVWQAVVLGFAGLRLTEEGYTTHPCWPASWIRLAFHFVHRGELVFVDLRR